MPGFLYTSDTFESVGAQLAVVSCWLQRPRVAATRAWYSVLTSAHAQLSTLHSALLWPVLEANAKHRLLLVSNKPASDRSRSDNVGNDPAAPQHNKRLAFVDIRPQQSIEARGVVMLKSGHVSTLEKMKDSSQSPQLLGEVASSVFEGCFD